MMDVLRRPWRSVGFRLAFYYGFLVAITMLAVLSILYLQTVGVLQQRMARQVAVVSQQLVARFDEDGAAAVAADIARALSDDRDADSEIYLLVDREGRRIAGNLARLPAQVPGDGAQRRVVRAGKEVAAYLVVQELSDGSTLVVGQDLRDQEAIEALVANASAAAGIVAVLLLVGGTFVFRQQLDRSVGAVRRTAARIAAGELQERVALSDEEDEFARLSRDINDMLDRIQLLMDGVRHVSDTIAHNLRTPLTRVLLRLRGAQREGASPHERQQAIASTIDELEELVAVSTRLMQIAEAEAGARRASFAPVALDAIADEVLELYEALAEDQGATLERVPAEEACVSGDRDLLAGVAVNLLDNALKYAGPGAVIRIGTQTTPDGQARLTVQDDGPGIPVGEYARMGTRFHRLDRSRPGHGLGLASVRAVVALHGGSLAFEDAQPGLAVHVEMPARVD